MRILPIVVVALLTALISADAAKKDTAPTGSQIRIDTEPDGAQIFFDGTATDLSDLTINNVPNGIHLFTATKEGYITQRKSVNIKSEKPSILTFKLEPITGLIIVQSDPTGAELSIDGASRGKTPLLISDLKPGKYRMKLVAPGYKPKETDIDVAGRKPVKYNMELSSDSASLTISSSPAGAGISINGGDRGVTPTTISKLPSGNYIIELNIPGYEASRQALKLTSGMNESVSAVLKPLPSTLKIVSDPAGAKVYVENQIKGNSPLELPALNPGDYRIRVESLGYEPLARNITIKPAAKLTEEFKLEKNSGMLEITTEPAGVRILIDGHECGETSAKPGEADTISQVLQIDLVKPGERVVKFTKKGYFTKTAKVVIENGKSLPMQQTLNKKFIPDLEITTSSEVYKGMHIDTAEDGTVRIEIRPGVVKKLPGLDIISRKPIITSEPKEE